MKFLTRIFLGAIVLTASTAAAFSQDSLPAPKWNLKTNLLYDAVGTINLGAELRTGLRTSVDVPVSYNPWQWGNDRKWKHILVQPGLRWWHGEVFDGLFFGVHAHYAFYNVGNLPHGPFSQHMSDSRFEGWLAGAGFGAGYRWRLSDRVGIETELGFGYAYMSYKRYECHNCDKYMGKASKNYFGPTKAAVNLIVGMGRKPAPAVEEPVVEITPVRPDPYLPKFTPLFVRLDPSGEVRKRHVESGRTYLDFTLGSSAIDTKYKNNSSELAKMDELIESVRNDGRASITGIDVTGYASIEGTWARNQTLSERRAAALKNYIRDNTGVSEALFTVRGAGEDWDGLAQLVAASDMLHRDRVLEIIRTTDIFAGRETKLMALAAGVPYRNMRSTMFPQLRRVDYSVDFGEVPFDMEDGKRVFRTDPQSLTLHEMSRIAETYDAGTTPYREVWEAAARIYPDSDEANMNAAASALVQKDADRAAGYLDRVGRRTPEWWNNMGIVHWLRGDAEQAAECFANAGAQGAANAAEMARYKSSIDDPATDPATEAADAPPADEQAAEE